MKKNKFIYFYILLFGLLTQNCHKTQCIGFTLQNFKIIEPNLEILVQDLSLISHNLNHNLNTKDSHIVILELNKFDSIPEFWFNFNTRDYVNAYISDNNKRIVGYITYNEEDIILLSNMNVKIDFEMFFYKFIQPTQMKKRFDYIFFNESQYQVDKDGWVLPPNCRIQNYKAYIFNNNEMILIENEKWYKDRISPARATL